jgi:hypothetical protein
VVAAEVPPAQGARLLERFLTEFAELSGVVRIELLGPSAATNLERVVRPEHLRPARAGGSVAWLAGGRPLATCHRFERWRALPVLEIDLATIDDAWATSWPGAFVSFDLSRALVVSVDYEAFRCELRGRGATPYR